MQVTFILDILREYYKQFKAIILPYFQEYKLDSIDSAFIAIALFIVLTYLCNKIKFPSRDYNQSIWSYIKQQLFILFVKYTPGISSLLDKFKEKEIGKLTLSMDQLTSNKTFKIPDNGMSYAKIIDRMDKWIERDKTLYGCGKVSGSLYIGQDQKFIEECQEFVKNFIYSNPMHSDLWPATRQMEAEVIRMTGDLFGQTKEAIGMLTTGGTESILLAMLAYRNWGEQERGILKPNIVIPETAHAAFYRAGEYFKIEIRIAKVNQKTFQVDVNDLKKHINSNTVCIVGSFPNFPYGTQDPIEQLANIAKSKKVGLHVDACLGGFTIAFAKESGIDLGKFDFNLDGVTSISCDQHKHGLAPKGVSTVLFKTRALRQFAFFSIATWSGGAYATPSLQGSKTGSGAAGAWFTMQSIGRKRYCELSKKVMEATKQLAQQINEIPELEVCGTPQINCVCFISKVKSINAYSIHQILHNKGWTLNTTQKPAGIHISITHQNISNLKQYVQDIKDSITEIKANPEQYKKGGDMGALYGTTQKIPDSKFAGNALKLYLDSLLKI